MKQHPTVRGGIAKERGMMNEERIRKIEDHIVKQDDEIKHLRQRVAALEKKKPGQEKGSYSSQLWVIKEKIRAKEALRSEMYAKYSASRNWPPEVMREYQRLRREIQQLNGEMSEL